MKKSEFKKILNDTEEMDEIPNVSNTYVTGVNILAKYGELDFVVSSDEGWENIYMKNDDGYKKTIKQIPQVEVVQLAQLGFQWSDEFDCITVYK